VSTNKLEVLQEVADVLNPDHVEERLKGRLRMLATHWPAVTSLLYLYPRELMQELHPLRMVDNGGKV
jgi:hypothetical protein